jgi:adenosylcobinamide kinase/adenosylcobinamide-phosphate guanylyltransferase
MSIILVTGGARSGKSQFAEKLALESNHVTYIATAQPTDDEMINRIEHHRSRRPAHWQTIEAPLYPGLALSSVSHDTTLLLLDCMALWTANRLLNLGDSTLPDWWRKVDELEKSLVTEIETFCTDCSRSHLNLILVTNEVGLGLVPTTELGRAFRDMLGRINQRAAAISDEAFLLVSGIPVKIKPGII